MKVSASPKRPGRSHLLRRFSLECFGHSALRRAAFRYVDAAALPLPWLEKSSWRCLAVPSAVVGYARMTSWFYGQLATLLDRLAAIPYGQGKLIDVALVHSFSRHGDGGMHNHHWIPTILAGGRAQPIATGRFVRVPKTDSGRLCLAIARAAGVSLASFGPAPYTATEPLAL